MRTANPQQTEQITAILATTTDEDFEPPFTALGPEAAKLAKDEALTREYDKQKGLK